MHGTVESLGKKIQDHLGTDKKVHAILSLWMGDMLITNSIAIEGVLKASETLLVGESFV